MSKAGSTPSIRLLDGHFYTEDPHRHFRWMRQHAPVYWDASGSVWGVALHEDIMAISKDTETFCSRLNTRPDGPLMPSLINLDDPDHKRRRSLVNKGFTPRRVQEHELRVRQICRQLIDRVASQGRCDFVSDLAAPLPMTVIGDLLGVEPADHDMLLRWSDEMLAATSSTATLEVFERAQRSFEEYADYHRRVVAHRKARPRNDLMSVLVHAEVDGQKLGGEEILQDSLLILVGGDETTRHVLSGGMEQLVRNPAQRHVLIRNPAKIPVAVEEMLRWVSPIQNMNRTATCPVELRGQSIREGDKILLLYPSANRDERVFDRPGEFIVTREPNNHVAFGGYGAHFCLGASLARLELRVMFEELLQTLPDMELASAAVLPLRPSNFIVGIESMPVVFPPRHVS